MDGSKEGTTVTKSSVHGVEVCSHSAACTPEETNRLASISKGRLGRELGVRAVASTRAKHKIESLHVSN